MTIQQAKKDAQAKLAKHGIVYQSMKGRTVDFGDLAHGCPNQTFECRGCNAAVAFRNSYCPDCR